MEIIIPVLILLCFVFFGIWSYRRESKLNEMFSEMTFSQLEEYDFINQTTDGRDFYLFQHSDWIDEQKYTHKKL